MRWEYVKTVPLKCKILPVNCQTVSMQRKAVPGQTVLILWEILPAKNRARPPKAPSQ